VHSTENESKDCNRLFGLTLFVAIGFSCGDSHRFAMRNSNNFLFYNVLVGLLYKCMVRHDCELALRYVAP
jgi:hypothetical protein